MPFIRHVLVAQDIVQVNLNYGCRFRVLRKNRTTEMKQQSLPELIQDALSLFRDHPRQVGELIHWVATLDDEARTALILAYQWLYKKDE